MQAIWLYEAWIGVDFSAIAILGVNVCKSRQARHTDILDIYKKSYAYTKYLGPCGIIPLRWETRRVGSGGREAIELE